MTDPTAVDTSLAVPLLVQRHSAHDTVRSWADGRQLALAGHALTETYAVLTRLPGDLRVAPRDAVRLIDSWFAPPLQPRPDTLARLHDLLARAQIFGGAGYDAVVALCARDADVVLATRDARAVPTYERIGVDVEQVV